MPYLDASYALPFQGQSDTSREAAEKARHFIGRQGRAVEGFVSRCSKGATQMEIAECMGIGRPSVCARVRALELAGRLRKTEERRGNCAVYVSTERAL